MQSWYLLGPSSSDGGGGFFLPSRKPPSLLGLWRCSDGHSRRSADRPGPVAAAGAFNGGDQDHYAVLGLPRSASTAEVKRAFRLLARKYHPDVSRDLQAGEVFKSIHLAYEVLSDEATRAQYDMALKFPGTTEGPWRGRWTTHNDESDERRRMHRWAKLRQRMQYEKQNRETSWYDDQRDTYHASSHSERGSLADVLQFALFALFFTRVVGYRATLAFCGLAALFDKRLDGGYKMGYAIAWLLGGRGGVLLASCVYFTSWLCGKNSSSLVAVAMVAIWVAAHVSSIAPLPQGAVLALLHMSIKLQDDLK